MHTVQTVQTLAHRAPPATRTRVRWQPYNSTPSSSRNILLHTPLTVSPSPIATTSCNISSRPTSSLPIVTCPKDIVIKEPPKQKGSVSIVDQAVKALCEIWRPQDIPESFLPPRGPISSSNESRSVLEHTKHAFRSNSQQFTHLPLCVDSTNTASPSHDQGCNRPTDPSSNMATMKCFIHEVLRRSRTSGCILQTALCYLEAIRAKVPELLEEERAGIRHDTSIPRIITQDELDGTVDLGSEASFDMDGSLHAADDSIVKTVRIVDQSADAFSSSEPNLASAQINADVSGALPSPLLCPRRAFLASLILASKFTQDKCYSNRAWAKLSGLPPKEIGRCERALGEALDWRLWVGKQSPPAAPSGQRALSRSQSEPSLAMPIPPLSSSSVENVLSKPHPNANQSGLRRCATLPAEAYASQMPRSLAESSLWQRVDVCKSSQDQDFYMGDSDVPFKMHEVPCSSDRSSSSPSPSTPGLAYSPSSSESSAGDQTVQMSTYFDEPIQTPAAKTWPWPDHGSQLGMLDNTGLRDVFSKSALDLSSILAPGSFVSESANLEVSWYPDHLSHGSFAMPTLHTVECS
jgi:hypothetical protein